MTLHWAARLTLLLFACLPALAWGLDPDRRLESFSVRAWTMQDGLPHNMVHDIAQDQDGFLWLATWEGLSRFNGRRFTTFDTANIPGLHSRGFRSLYRDRDDSLLTGSNRSGVWVHRDDQWRPLAAQALDGAWVTRFLRSRDGSLWIGTEDGILQLDARGQLVAHYGQAEGLEQPWIYALAEMPDGSILIGAHAGLFRVVPGQPRASRYAAAGGLPPGPVRVLLYTPAGELLATADNGLYRLEGNHFIALPAFDNIRIDALLMDRDGALWANTSLDGLLRWSNGRLERLGPQQGFTGRGTGALLEDREGLLWAGTTDGLYRIADTPVKALNREDGLGDNYVRSVLATRDGDVWIGHGRGVDRWHAGRVQAVEVPWQRFANSSVQALAEDDGGIWLGTYDEGLLRLPRDPRGPVVRLGRTNGLPADQIRALLTDRDGSLWIGTSWGLVHRQVNGQLETIDTDVDLAGQTIRSLYQAQDGSLWVGIGDGILQRHPDGRIQVWSRKHLPAFPATSAFDFLEDGQGSLWIASDRGLIRFRSQRFTVYGQAEGLPNESLFRLVRDARGELWMSSNRGVFHLPKTQFDELDRGQRQRLAVQVYDHGDGMPSAQANGNSYPAGALTADGQFWVPTAAGVALVDTNPEPTIHDPSAMVPVVIESMQVDGKPRRRDDQRPLSSQASRRVVIQFAGLNFRHADNLQYRYRLEGFDTEWVEAGTGTEAVYTNLPAGDYRFRVQALVRPADWERARGIDEAQLTLQVMPPFWLSRWFILLVAVSSVVVLVAAWFLRDRRHARRQAELSAIVEQRTLELRERNNALHQAIADRQQLVSRLETQARQDELTGLPNRRAANLYLASCEPPLQVALLDIDHFKTINDQHGHHAGDHVLQVIAACLRDQTRDIAYCARFGGEEFVLIFPPASQAEALRHCENLRQAIAALHIPLEDGPLLACTISIGLSRSLRQASPDQLLYEADQQLYRAKRNGRNRVCRADDAETGVH